MDVNFKTKKYFWVFDLLAVVFLLTLLGWNIAKLENESRSSPIQEDHWGTFVFSDYLTMMAGERFSEGESFYDYTLQNMTVGYNEFSRAWTYYQVPLTNHNAEIYYTHSGPMDGVINGILRHFGVTNLTTFVEVNVIMMIFALGFWYLIASALFGRIIGLVSLLFMGTTLSSVHFTSTICAHGQEWFFAFSAVFLFLLAQKSSGRFLKRAGYGGAWVMTFIQAANTTEFIPWLQIFFIGYLWISRGKLSKMWKPGLFMFSAPVASLVIHWAIIAGAFGGFQNLITDITAGVARRTVEFTLAEEIPFQSFDLGQTIPFLNGELKFRTGMDFIDMGILIALIIGLYILLRKISPDLEKRQISAQMKMLLVFLIGGFAFQVVFIQATVSQTTHMFKTIIPFEGLLIGFSIVMFFRYVTIKNKSWYIFVPISLILFIIAVPMAKDRIQNYEPTLDTYTTIYYGRTQSEIRILTGFVRDNTSYGDIVITDMDTGATGMPRYPFPAYEYLSGRRFEITASDVPGIQHLITEFEEVRQSLPATNPASRINYYLLLESESNMTELGEFARLTGEPAMLLDTEAWWKAHNSDIPTGERKIVFYLYKINITKVQQ